MPTNIQISVYYRSVQFILLTYVFVYIMHEYNFADISAFISII